MLKANGCEFGTPASAEGQAQTQEPADIVAKNLATVPAASVWGPLQVRASTVFGHVVVHLPLSSKAKPKGWVLLSKKTVLHANLYIRGKPVKGEANGTSMCLLFFNVAKCKYIYSWSPVCHKHYYMAMHFVCQASCLILQIYLIIFIFIQFLFILNFHCV